jgi:RND family efflux transporter MFP subunit
LCACALALLLVAPRPLGAQDVEETPVAPATSAGEAAPGGGVYVEGTAMAWDRITVSSPVEEIVAEVMVDEGDKVEKGDVLAQLAVRKQELEVQRLEQLIAKARFSYEATSTLFKENIESRETLMEKKAELDELLVGLEIAKVNVEERRILSPVSGTVVHRLRDPGESAGRVEPLFEIINDERLKLMFFLPVRHLANLEPGLTCEIDFPDLPDLATRQATLIFLDPQVDARSGLFRARFELDNADAAIRTGMRVRARLPKAE